MRTRKRNAFVKGKSFKIVTTVSKDGKFSYTFKKYPNGESKLIGVKRTLNCDSKIVDRIIENEKKYCQFVSLKEADYRDIKQHESGKNKATGKAKARMFKYARAGVRNRKKPKLEGWGGQIPKPTFDDGDSSGNKPE